MPRVNPEVLSWAREQAGLDPEDACRKIQLNAARGMAAHERLARLESGEDEPSRPLLLRMAKAYRRPLVVFFMSRPPIISDKGQDFRTLPEGERDATTDALLSALIRDVQARQSLVREALEDADEAEARSFIGSKTVNDGQEEVLRAIRHDLALNLQTLIDAANPGEAFALLREAVESRGVFVLLKGDLGSHHTAFDVKVFRGFALADSIAPFIVINDRDSRSAWSFTLLHELVHLWLGQTGVSAAGSDLEIEQFCNDVASEFLLPAVDLHHARLRLEGDLDDIARSISEFAGRRNVSSSMVAYKLYRLHRIEREQWLRLRGRFRDLWLQSRQQERHQARLRESGPNYYVVRRHRVGPALINVTGRLMRSGALTTTEAGLVLGVRAKQVSALL